MPAKWQMANNSLVMDCTCKKAFCRLFISVTSAWIGKTFSSASPIFLSMAKIKYPACFKIFTAALPMPPYAPVTNTYCINGSLIVFDYYNKNLRGMQECVIEFYRFGVIDLCLHG